ncbi:MAG: class I tRNA ligase family protein, partial [Caldilineaceae bacterium]|nr:class I tRNA ligase family protein [Caldilineaceae bacterium]
MSTNGTKILVGVAWPYVNGEKHIGQIAGAYLPPDIFARYERMAGNDVLMVSGSDTHGTPIMLKADKEGLTPQQTADKYHRIIAEDLQALGCSYDLYTRTTTANHYAVAQELFRQNWLNGYMVEQTTSGAISPSTGRTLPDRYIEGTCPICGADGARGDQCD